MQVMVTLNREVPSPNQLHLPSNLANVCSEQNTDAQIDLYMTIDLQIRIK